jgi:hypothetical protein
MEREMVVFLRDGVCEGSERVQETAEGEVAEAEFKEG